MVIRETDFRETDGRTKTIQDIVVFPGGGAPPAETTSVRLDNSGDPLGMADPLGVDSPASVATAMNDDDHVALGAQLEQLRQEHRDLDAAIEALHNAPGSDLLQVQRLKKRKLHLRDRIIEIEDQLTPDIIA